MKLKNWLSPLALGVIAFFAGYYVANEMNETKKESYMRTIVDMHAVQVLTYEGIQSADAYKNESPHVGIALLKHNIEWLNSFKTSALGIMSPDVLIKDIAITYVRLSKLYDRLGNRTERDNHLQKAVDIYRSSSSEITKDQLLQLVGKMDKSIMTRAEANKLGREKTR